MSLDSFVLVWNFSLPAAYWLQKTSGPAKFLGFKILTNWICNWVTLLWPNYQGSDWRQNFFSLHNMDYKPLNIKQVIEFFWEMWTLLCLYPEISQLLVFDVYVFTGLSWPPNMAETLCTIQQSMRYLRFYIHVKDCKRHTSLVQRHSSTEKRLNKNSIDWMSSFGTTPWS